MKLNMNFRIRNRWLVVIGAISSQLGIGALYAWSHFNEPISIAFGWSITSVYTTYTIALATFALTMNLTGWLQLKWGPRITSLIGGILYSGGVLLSSLAKSHAALYIFYGVITGAGVAFVYVCQLATLVKWFPNRKGAITGLATAGFALGGFMFSNILKALFNVEDIYLTPEKISITFLIVGSIFAVMTIGGALLLDVPEQEKAQTNDKFTEGKNFNRLEMLKTGNFYKLLFSDMLALMPGLLIIGLAKDIGQDPEYLGLNYSTAALIVSIIAIINAGGRLLSGALADKLGALNVYRTMYVVTIISLAVLAFVPMSLPVFIIAIFGVAIAYGSFLSLVPTITGRLFGGNNFSANYALVFQAYGIAALSGILIKSLTTETNYMFMIAMSTTILGFIIAMLIKPSNGQQEDEKEDEKEDESDTVHLTSNLEDNSTEESNESNS
ncbi:MAG: L-lactate MFS transporter [Candidatus Heimdallarchaeota archaeon]